MELTKQSFKILAVVALFMLGLPPTKKPVLGALTKHLGPTADAVAVAEFVYEIIAPEEKKDVDDSEAKRKPSDASNLRESASSKLPTKAEQRTLNLKSGVEQSLGSMPLTLVWNCSKTPRDPYSKLTVWGPGSEAKVRAFQSDLRMLYGCDGKRFVIQVLDADFESQELRVVVSEAA